MIIDQKFLDAVVADANAEYFNHNLDDGGMKHRIREKQAIAVIRAYLGRRYYELPQQLKQSGPPEPGEKS